MKVAFTGPRPPQLMHVAERPFSDEERVAIRGLLDEFVPGRDQIGTGLCLGVDAIITNEARIRGFWTVAFLPTDRSMVAYLVEVDESRSDPAWDHKRRDRELVAWCDRLRGIALHAEARQPRSGTWYTIRAARRAGKLDREPLILRPRLWAPSMPPLHPAQERLLEEHDAATRPDSRP